MKRFLIVISIIGILALLRWFSQRPMVWRGYKGLHEMCMETSAQAKEDFKNTQFANFDFYGSCLLNAKTSPLFVEEGETK